MELIQKIKDLRVWITTHDRYYYQDSNPMVSDHEYDEAVLLLRSLEAEAKRLGLLDLADPGPLDRVSGEIDEHFKVVLHKIPMLSLNNAFNSEDIGKFIERLENKFGANLSFWCEPKIDGLSFMARYIDGKLSLGATRGNGIMGEDVTHNIVNILNLPHSLESRINFEVRGEVYISKSDFVLVNKMRSERGLPLFSNPRNAASGSLRCLEGNELKERRLKCLMWGAIFEDDTSLFQHELILRLRDMGLPIQQNAKICNNITDILEYYNSILNMRAQLDYEIDGIVYKLDNIVWQREMGQTNKAPRWAIAHKFPASSAKTRIISIDVQVGRTGALTPVANLEPVNCGGVIIARASLHNEDEIKRKDFRIGDVVVVERSGDVIPYLKHVDFTERSDSTKDFNMPRFCPSCGSDIVLDHNYAVQRCLAFWDCPAQIEGRLQHFVSRNALDIEGLGERVLHEFYQEGIIKNVVDIFTLEARNAELNIQNRSGWGEKSAINLFKSIKQSRRVYLDKLIYALGIRHVGVVGAKVLAKRFKDLESLIEVSNQEDAFARISNISGIGEVAATSIINFFCDNNALLMIRNLLSHLELISYEQNQSLSQYNIVFTGSMQLFTRAEAILLAEQKGATVANGISKKVNLVVAGENAGSKLKKAVELKIKIIDEQEYKNLLEEIGYG